MPYLSPPTLTRPEQDALLQASKSNPRDHLLFSLALGTGLRLSEITGLNVGDLFTQAGQPRSRMRLRREIAKGGRAGDVFLPDALMPKLVRFWSFKVRSGERLDANAPLFCNQSGDRISNRRVQIAFRTWQERTGFNRFYSVHALRHTAVTNVYRASRDLFLTQRFARHVSPLTTIVYTWPSDQELFQGIKGMRC